MKRMSRIVIAAAAATVTQFSVSNSNAAPFTWDGGGNGNITDGANWIGDNAPAIAGGDTVTFTGSVNTTPTVNQSIAYLSMLFDGSASPFTLGGSNTITLGTAPSTAGTLSSTGANTQTFNNPFAFNAGTIAVSTGTLVFNNAVNIGNGGSVSANGVRIAGNGFIAFNSALASSVQTGSTALNIGVPTTTSGDSRPSSFNGTVTFSADSSGFAGNVFIDGGAVRISNGNALGSTGTIETSLSSGGTGKGVLELVGNITVNKNVVTRARTGATASNAMIRNISGNNTVTNVYTNTGGSTFSYASESGKLTIANWNTTITGTGRFLNLQGAGDGEITNWTNHNGSTTLTVNKSGGGTWVLSPGMSTGTFQNVTVTGGTLTFDGALGARVFGNATISTGGTLKPVATGGTTGEIGLTNPATPITIAVNQGGLLDATTFTSYSLPTNQTIIGGGTISTGGQIRVWGNNILHVGNSIGAVGSLVINGNLDINGDQLSGAANNTLNFDLASTNTVGSGVNDLISVNGNLILNDFSTSRQIPVSLNALNGVLSGTYRLIDYTGSLVDPSGAGTGNFSVNVSGATDLRPGWQFNLDLSTANQLNLDVVGGGLDLTWAGDGAGNAWDVNSTSNWNAGAQKFYSLDAVTFDNSTSNTTVNLAASALIPASIVVDNDASHNYTFAGAGSISGGTTLTKNGVGRLTLTNSGSNNFTGTTTINAGTLDLGGGGGSLTGNLGAGPIVNNGALVLNHTTATTLNNVVSGSGSIEINNGAVLGGNNVAYDGTIVVNTGSLFPMNDNALGTATGATVIEAGAQFFTNSARNFAAEPIVLRNNAADFAGAIRVGGGASITLGGPVTIDSAGSVTFEIDGGSALNINGNITATNNQGLYLRGDNTTTGSVINGAINLGSGSLVIQGGVHTLGGANTYTGNTTVNSNSTLRVANTQALQNSTVVGPGAVAFQGVTAATFGGLGLSGNVSLQNETAAPVALTVGGNGQSTAYSGVMSGAGSLTKTGSGVLTIGPSAQTYAGATVISGGTLRLAAGAPGPAAPVAGSVLWYDADSEAYIGGDAVTLLHDRSAGGNDAASGYTPSAGSITTASAPTFGVGTLGLNGNPTIRFSGDAYQGLKSLSALNITGDAPRTIFSVMARTAPTGATGAQISIVTGSPVAWEMFGQEMSAFASYPASVFGQEVAAATTAEGQFAMLSGVHTANLTEGWYNGTFVNDSIVGSLTTGAAQPVYIGDRGGTRWSTGALAEMIVYDTALSTADRRAVEAYLNYKWFIAQSNLLPANTAVSITASGATLDLNGVHQTIGSLAGVTGSEVTLGTAALTTGGDNTSTAFDGDISGVGGSLVKTGIGSFTLGGSNTYTGGTTVNNGALIVNNKIAPGPVTVNAGSLKVAAKGTANHVSGTSVVSSLSIASGASLDLTNNSMVIDYSGAVGTLEDDVREHLQNSRLITSSAGAGKKLGYGDNAVLSKGSFGGETVDADSMLIKFTFAGDANLDGQVTISDLGDLASNWQSTSAFWRNGDFNYDGAVTISDLGDLASNWQAGVGSPLGMSFQEALAAVGFDGAAVPEPVSLALVGFGAMALRRRRSR